MIYSEKTLAVVGVADEDVARLCLLLRRILPRLQGRWRWGVASRADLVIVDASNVVGWMGWTRARASGVRCALIASSESQQAEYALSRPFEASALEFALNDVSRESAPPPGLQPYLYDFYYDELGCPGEARKQKSATPAAVGLDEYLRTHSDYQIVVERPALPQVASLRQAALAAHIDPPTNPAAWHLEPVRRSRGGLSLVHSRRDDEQTRHTLWGYLTGHLMIAPRRLEKAGLPTLVLDPINRVFHSESLLRQLQPHCNVSTALSEWQAVGPAELQHLRREQPAQPYSKLLWLDALTHSDGQLALHLDATAMYRLKQWLEIDDSLPRQQRIATSMVRARRLDEISETSRVSMADVFDAVSAFDAIGHVEWSPVAAQATANSNNGERIHSLVSRLRRLIETHGRENIGLGQLRSMSA
ncbi:MAG: hypothetical protein WAV67_09000 [Dokdonella sp.]